MAGNDKRGLYQVTVKDSDGNRETYKLQFNHGALRALEAQNGPMGHFDQRMQAGHQGIDDLLCITWGALQKHHEDDFATVDQVAELFDTLMDENQHDSYHALLNHSMDSYRDAVEAFEKFSRAPSENGSNGSKNGKTGPKAVPNPKGKSSTSGTSSAGEPSEQE